MPEDPDPKLVRKALEAEGYYELGLYEDALERADRLLGVAAFADFALSMKAECLRSLDRFEDGAPVFEEILRRDPENVSAWVGLGWCRKRTGRLDLALEAMERLLAERPGEAIGLFNLACYCSLAGERDRALELLGKAIRADPQYRELARKEEDFADLRDDPGFRRVVEGDGSERRS